MSRSNAEGGFGAVLILFGVFYGFFLASPGLLAVHGASQLLDLRPDTGQLWSWGLSVSAVYLLGHWRCRGAGSAFIAYTALCFGAAWFLGMAHWGMHAAWTGEFLELAIPGYRQ